MWVSELKHKVIREYNQMVLSYEVGKSFDYTHILDMINLIETGISIPNASMISKSFMMDE
jgi:hypothetical protein